MTDVDNPTDADEKRNNYDLGVLFNHLKRFCVVNIRWITRVVTLLIAILLALHAFYPPSVEWVGAHLHLAAPSLAAILTLVVTLWLLERILVLQEEIRQPPLRVHDRRGRAYNFLSKLIEHRGAKKVDLLQVSGNTVLRLLRDLAESNPKAKVRLLLMHPETAIQFDTDQKPDHRERILTTVRDVDLMEDDYPGFKVTKRYYKTPAGVSAVVVDREIVSISWYYCYKDPKNPHVTRIRGHLAPTVTAVGDAAQVLLKFARERFDTVWVTAGDEFK